MLLGHLRDDSAKAAVDLWPGAVGRSNRRHLAFSAPAHGFPLPVSSPANAAQALTLINAAVEIVVASKRFSVITDSHFFGRLRRHLDATTHRRRQHFSPADVAREWHDASIEKTRVDVWLWAVRIYKTRSEATAACRGGHVRVNRAAAKASAQVKVGDRIDAFVGRPRSLEVAAIIEKRVGAAAAARCLIDHSPPVPVVKRMPRVFVREPGTGRPTKRERRELDRLMRPSD